MLPESKKLSALFSMDSNFDVFVAREDFHLSLQCASIMTFRITVEIFVPT